jgi:hypothetical protein
LSFHISEAYPPWITISDACFVLFLDLCSLERNELGPEGGTAIAEALKVNQTLQDIQ